MERSRDEGPLMSLWLPQVRAVEVVAQGRGVEDLVIEEVDGRLC
jgi:hypothetical protein